MGKNSIKKRRRCSLKPLWQRKLAMESINYLLKEAEKAAKRREYELSKRYVFLAKRTGMKYNVRIPGDLKRKICKNCLVFLIPGKNAKVRILSKKKRVVVTCLLCNHVRRFPYAKEKSRKNIGND